MSNRSGKLVAHNDPLINLLIDDPLYEVREDGTIWTLMCETGKVSVNNVWREAGWTDDRGYRKIKYHSRPLLVHRIIYGVFNGPISEDLVINHIDGNRTNNLPENLELITQSENNTHRFQVLGREPVKGNKKISQEIAEQIRADRSEGLVYKDLMKKYGLCKSTISYVCNNKTWK